MVEPFRIDLKGDELHLKLGGGIPKNAFVLIEAPNGVGKSVLAQRFAYGAIMNEHKITYISSEMALLGFMNQMTSLRYDVRSQIVTKRLKFVTLFPALGKIQVNPNLIEKLLYATELFDSDLIFFDTLSDLLVKKDMSQTECFDLITFFKKIVSMDKSIIFCVDPETLNKTFFSLLQAVSDVYIKMEERELYGNKIKVMKVERFNGAMGEVEEEIPFKVKAGIGIVVELAS